MAAEGMRGAQVGCAKPARIPAVIGHKKGAADVRGAQSVAHALGWAVEAFHYV
jgi:hypothetical protein